MSSNNIRATPSFTRLLAQYKAQVYEQFTLLGEITGKKNINATLRKSTILVIEDNADDWFFIRWALLRAFPQTEAVWLSKADQVIPYLETCGRQETDLPRLISLDLYLPSATAGISLLQALKSHYIYRKIPVVTLSHSTDPSDIAEVFNYSADSYVTKPTDGQGWEETFIKIRNYWQESLT